jgi:hypothetical protein
MLVVASAHTTGESYHHRMLGKKENQINDKNTKWIR